MPIPAAVWWLPLPPPLLERAGADPDEPLVLAWLRLAPEPVRRAVAPELRLALDPLGVPALRVAPLRLAAEPELRLAAEPELRLAVDPELRLAVLPARDEPEPPLLDFELLRELLRDESDPLEEA